MMNSNSVSGIFGFPNPKVTLCPIKNEPKDSPMNTNLEIKKMAYCKHKLVVLYPKVNLTDRLFKG